MPGIKAKRKQLVRKTLMRAKAQGERAAEQRQESPEEYAQTEVQQGIYDVAARTGNTAKSTARMSYRKFRAMQEKRKNLTLQGSTQSASKLIEKEKVTVPTQAERREMFKKQRFRQKAIAAKTPAPQAPVPSSATPAPPPYRAQMQQRLKRQHLTREAVRRYLQKLDAEKPVILCGDLNVAHEDIDLKNPGPNRGAAGFSDQERGKLGELLAAGFTDSFRHLHPDATGMYSWWSMRFRARERNAGWRIDYFIVSDRLRDRIRSADIWSEVLGSDHCPVVLELDV